MALNKLKTEVIMQQQRAGENTTIPFRNERYFCANGAWYFETRGGKQEGPFTDRREMEGELILYIREQQLLSQSLQEPPTQEDVH